MVSSCFIFEWSSVPPAAAETHPRDASFGPSIRPENVSRLEWEDHLNGIWIRRNIHIYHHISSYIQNDPNISINHQVWNFCQACLRLWLRKALLYDLVGRQCLLRPGGRQVLPGSWEGHTCISFRPEIFYFEPPGVYIFQMTIDINGDNDD